MKLLFILFILSVSYGTSAQYLSLLNDENRWQISHYRNDNIIKHWRTDNRYIIGDTLIGEHTYKIIGQISSFTTINGISTSEEHIAAFMREETTTGKIYTLLYNEPNYPEEFLAFDQGVGIGDTLHLDYAFMNVVKDISSIVTKDNITRRKYTFEYNEIDELYFIEGIGGKNGLHYPLFPNFEHGQTLDQFCRNNVFIFPEVYIDACSVLTNITEPNKTDQIQVFPNPTFGVINFEGQINDSEHIQVYSTDGQLILRTPFKEQLDLETLKEGVYYLKVISSDGLFQLEKIIKY